MDWRQLAMLPAVHGAAAFLLAATFAYRAQLVAGVKRAGAAIAAKLPSRGQAPVYDAATHVVDMHRHDCLRKLRHDVSELPPEERTKGLELLDQVDELVRNVERAPVLIQISGISFDCCKSGAGDGPAPTGGGAA